MRIFWLLSAIVLISLPAQADTARDTLAAVAKCTDIAAATERLQCFDAAAAGAKTALAAQPQPIQQAAAQTGQPPAEEEEGGVLSWFGLSRPVKKTEDFGKPPVPTGPKEISEISASVLEFAKNPYGRSLFVLDNGQVWKQTDGDTFEVKDPAAGETMKVTIETAFMGSYTLKVVGRTGIVKVRRVK
ncbi:MAG: hypothetical protein K8S25_11605 [Alphaproteobacteria bacterium]|nr:hypothetical protein [Alphaproteobacteria bacterium]